MPNYNEDMSDGPYGITYYSSSNSDTLKSQAITDMQALGVTWLRYQLHWTSIENPQNTYTWTALDDAVSKCNTAGINIVFVIQGAPAWGLSGSIPSATPSATFATQVATRYNGSNGHGHLDAIEVFNEEFDSVVGHTDGTDYVAVAKAVVIAIKAAGFTGKIGAAALLGAGSTSHITTWLQNIYNAGVPQLFDYLNFHYYVGSGVPGISGTTGNNSQFLISFDQYWYTMLQVIANNNDAGRQIWCTEVGWPTSTTGGYGSTAVVTEAQQAAYLQYCLNSARLSNCMQKLFIYTMDIATSNNDGMSITQGLSPNEFFLASFSMFQQQILSYPTWPTPSTSYNPPIEVSALVADSSVTLAALQTRTITDTGVVWQIYLKDRLGKNAIDLTNLSYLNLFMRIKNIGTGGTNTGVGTFKVLNATQGLISYQWNVDDIGVVGSYSIQVSAYFPTGPVHFNLVSLTVITDY